MKYSYPRIQRITLGVSKETRGSKGFSSNPIEKTSKLVNSYHDAYHKTREQRALILINQGKLDEAELIYRELVAAGSKAILPMEIWGLY